MTRWEGTERPITRGEKTTAWALLAISALWEVTEWGYDQWLARGNPILGKRDTILDLIWDSLGALAAGVVALAMARD